MEPFILDEESLKKGWGADEQYWFSLKDYVIKYHYEFADYERPENLSEREFMLSLGYVPYFRVVRVELAKAYIEAVASHKLKEKLSKIEDEKEYIEAFWKYFNAYPHLSEGYDSFQKNYLIKTAIDWCEENKIEFKVV